jgi:hypothetical protein
MTIVHYGEPPKPGPIIIFSPPRALLLIFALSLGLWAGIWFCFSTLWEIIR